MKKLAIVGIAITLVMCGCGKKNEDYRAHETETFRREKMETFKKLNKMRSELQSALSVWNKGDEKIYSERCKLKLKQAAAAVSDSKHISDNFFFACDQLSCKGKDCQVHVLQRKMMLIVSIQCSILNAKDLPGIQITESHRQEIEKTIAEIENAIESLENPEAAIKEDQKNSKQEKR